MSKVLVTIFLFCCLLLFIVSPFGALASLMIFVLAAAFLSTIWTLVRVLATGQGGELGEKRAEGDEEDEGDGGEKRAGGQGLEY